MGGKIKIDYIFLLIFVPVILRALTPVFFKSAAQQIESFTFLNVITNYLYWVSFLFFFLRALTWQIVLKKIPLSFAYPFTSLSYVFLLIIGYTYFNEEVTYSNIIGAFLIILGTLILAKSKDKNG